MPDFAPSGTRNSWSLEGLLKLLEELSNCFDRVVYFRAAAPGSGMSESVTGDNEVYSGVDRQSWRSTQLNRVYNDTQRIRENLPKVLLLHDLLKQEGSNYYDRVNAAQLLLAASARVTVVAQGGAAVLASLASTNVVMLCRLGKECTMDRMANATGDESLQRGEAPLTAPDAAWWSKLNRGTIHVGGHEPALAWSAIANVASESAHPTCGATLARTYSQLRTYHDGRRVPSDQGSDQRVTRAARPRMP
eukprot:210245-Prymnesium_polylepis.1